MTVRLIAPSVVSKCNGKFQVVATFRKVHFHGLGMTMTTASFWKEEESSFFPSDRGQPSQGDPRPRRGGSPGAVGGAEGVPGAAAEAEAGAKRRGGGGGARGGGGGQRKGVRRPAAGDIRGGERLQEAGGRRGGKIHFACFKVHNSPFSPPGDPPRHLARLPLPPAPHPRCGATKELPGGDGADDRQRSHVEVPHRQRAGH